MTVSIDALAAMAEIEAAADAAEVASGGRPNRFGNRQLTPRTTDYANPISQKFTGQTLNPLDTVLINNAGDVVLDTVTNPYVSQDYTDFGLSGKTKAGNFTLSNALQDQAALQTDEDLNTEAGLASKINDLIQSINPFKSDWAQKNLYGKQSVAGPGYLPEKMTVKEYADAVAWVKTNFPDQDYQSATQIFEKAPTGTLTTAQQNQALVEQANISDEWLSEHMAQPHLSRTLNMLGSTGLITQAQQAENDIGAPGSWYGGTPVQEELGSGVGALSPSNINVSISQAVQDLQNQLDLSNLLSKESVDIPGTTRSWPAIPSQSWPAIPSQVMQNTQAEQDALDKETQFDSFYGIPTTTGTADDPLADDQAYMDFVNTLNAQPIGSSPLAHIYGALNQEQLSDFPANAGINAVGTSFPTQPPLAEGSWIDEDGKLHITITDGPETGETVVVDPESEDVEQDTEIGRSYPLDATRDRMRKWEGKPVSDEWTEWLPDAPLIVPDPKEKAKTKKEEKVTLQKSFLYPKSKYGTWDGKFNKKTAKHNQAAKLEHDKAWMSDFEKWEKDRKTTQKEINEMKRTDKYSKVYGSVHGTNKGLALVASILSKGVGTVGSGAQKFLTKKGAGNADTFDQTKKKMKDGEFQGQAEIPPPDPRDKVTGGFWGLLNFAKKNPKIFGSLSGDELWALVSEEEDFWKFYEAGLGG